MTVGRGAGRGRRVWWITRRVLGWPVLIAALVTAVLFGLGLVNPWRLVVLEYQFGNPMLGLLVVPPMALVGMWLALPVVNEATQAYRLGLRLLLMVLSLVGVIGWGVFGAHFSFEPRVAAQSPNGKFTVVLVKDRDIPPNQYVRIWHGSGLTAREVADLGRGCGTVKVRFRSAHQLEVSTAYGDWVVQLDPDTGEPRQRLGQRCGDPPVPVG